MYLENRKLRKWMLSSHFLEYVSLVWLYQCRKPAYRIEALLKKLKRLGFVPGDFKTFDELCDKIDDQLFEKILLARGTHVLLGQLLPEVRDTGKIIRARGRIIVPCQESPIKWTKWTFSLESGIKICTSFILFQFSLFLIFGTYIILHTQPFL